MNRQGYEVRMVFRVDADSRRRPEDVLADQLRQLPDEDIIEAGIKRQGDGSEVVVWGLGDIDAALYRAEEQIARVEDWGRVDQRE
jgi:hypothetical protein